MNIAQNGNVETDNNISKIVLNKGTWVVGSFTKYEQHSSGKEDLRSKNAMQEKTRKTK